MTESGSSTNAVSDSELAALIEEANTAFEKQCRARHEKGAEEYGDFTYLTAPTLDMALEELADMNNYVRYAYIRLYLFKNQMVHLTAQHEREVRGRNQDGFVPMSEVFGKGI
jgi:DNA-binding SARP family transcriptional activator